MKKTLIAVAVSTALSTTALASQDPGFQLLKKFVTLCADKGMANTQLCKPEHPVTELVTAYAQPCIRDRRSAYCMLAWPDDSTEQFAANLHVVSGLCRTYSHFSICDDDFSSTEFYAEAQQSVKVDIDIAQMCKVPSSNAVCNLPSPSVIVEVLDGPGGHPQEIAVIEAMIEVMAVCGDHPGAC